jgi:hypothetical protein
MSLVQNVWFKVELRASFSIDTKAKATRKTQTITVGSP